LRPCPNPIWLNRGAPKLTGVPEIPFIRRSQNKSEGHRQNSMSNAATAQKTNGKSATEEKAVMEVVKTESSNSAKTAENAILSLEKRIQKVQELNIVIDKWRKLQEARKNLNEFKLGNDGITQ
jgi:hypothetical protein